MLQFKYVYKKKKEILMGPYNNSPSITTKNEPKTDFLPNHQNTWYFNFILCVPIVSSRCRSNTKIKRFTSIVLLPFIVLIQHSMVFHFGRTTKGKRMHRKSEGRLWFSFRMELQKWNCNVTNRLMYVNKCAFNTMKMKTKSDNSNKNYPTFTSQICEVEIFLH